MPGHDIIVIGTSAGGMEALTALAGGLPPDLPAAVFVVWHLSPESAGLLPRALAKAGPLPAANAVDGEEVRPGRIYVAPPDRHLVLQPGRVRLTKGPKENRFRPAVDPLFRSAALAYGPRVIGVILTGSLDDGTTGLWAVKQRGGVAVVQDPREAAVSGMPRSALEHVRVDYCLPLNQMAPLLARLAREEAGPAEGSDVEESIRIETKIALEDNALAIGVTQLGTLTAYTCPECHGTLLQMKTGGVLRFRCHTGHAYTLASLLAELTVAMEDSLWGSLRTLEEGMLVLEHLGRHVREAGETRAADDYAGQAADVKRQADLVRQALMKHPAPTARPAEGGMPSRGGAASASE